MDEKQAKTVRRYQLSAAAVLLLILMCLGVRDALQTPVIGMELDSDLVVVSVDPYGPARQAGLAVGDRILKINGHSAMDKEIIAEQGRTVRIGQTMTYQVQHADGVISDLVLEWQALPQPRKVLIVINGLFSAFLLGLITITYCRKPEFVTALLFYLLGLMYLFFRMDHPRWHGEFMARLYQEMYLFSFFIVPALFLHFCLRFPRKNPFFYEKEGRINWLYAPAIIMFIPAAIVNWIHFNDFKAGELITKIILIQGFILWMLYLMVGTLAMLNAYFRIRSRVLARRCSLVFYALILAVAPYLIAGLLQIVGGRSFTHEIIAIILFLPLPLTIAWSIDYGEDRMDGMNLLLQKIMEAKNQH